MFSFIRPVLATLLIGGLCDAALADADLDVGIDIQVEHAHQTFSNDSANINTVDLAPHLQYGNWDFSLDAPWISANGNFVNSNFPPRWVTQCDKAAALAQKYPRSKRAAKAVQTCQSLGIAAPDDSVSGMSDVTVFARYGTSLDEQGIWLLSFGAGYKFDNGDVDENLGSGTRNTLLEASLGASYGKFTGTLTGGHALVNGGNQEDDSSHYNYASLDLGLSPREWVTLGFAVDYDQSYVITADDVTQVTAYVKFKPSQHVRLKVYARDYGNAEGYPEREYGGSMTLVY